MSRRSARQRVEDAREDYHDPTARFVHASPARSALTLRIVLAAFGFVVCAGFAAAFVTVVDQPGWAGFVALLALVGLVDLIVVLRRKHRGEPG